jgi:hypothetical protein
MSDLTGLLVDILAFLGGENECEKSFWGNNSATRLVP